MESQAASEPELTVGKVLKLAPVEGSGGFSDVSVGDYYSIESVPDVPDVTYVLEAPGAHISVAPVSLGTRAPARFVEAAVVSVDVSAIVVEILNLSQREH